MTVVAMTRREFSRLEVVVSIEEGQVAVECRFYFAEG
jgi:hypothetical protein